MNRTRVLLSAYQCAPGQGSVSQIGWEWYKRLSAKVSVSLVTHARNRKALEKAGAPLPGTTVEYIDTEWFAGKLYRFAKWLFPKSEHAIFLLSSVDYYLYDWITTRRLGVRGSEWDLIHAVTPVAPAAYTTLTRLGLPLVRGPLNGGLRTPTTFPDFMKSDSAWMYRLRGLSDLFGLPAALCPQPTITLTANDSSSDALSARERRNNASMPEIAVDTSLYPSMPWPAAPSKDSPLRILFIGRLIAAKALPLLIESLRRLDQTHNYQLVVAGDGPMRQCWEADARGLGDRVRFIGSQSQQSLANELRESHVLCLPSVRESGGAVLLEAMSSSRPIVAVNYGGPANIVKQNFGRLVSAEGPEATIRDLTATWLDVFQHPETWAERGKAARIEAEQVHSWDIRIDQMLAYYSNCLRNAPDRAQAATLEGNLA